MTDASVVLRAYNPEKDQAFLYSTWRNSVFYDLDDQDMTKAKAWFKFKTAKIKSELIRAKVLIACLSDDPDFILGYSVANVNHLLYVYVRADYRRQGIGALLVEKNIETYTDDLTKIGRSILKKKQENADGSEEGKTK